MKIIDIIAREALNKDHIYLYPNGEFYSAFQLSAFLINTYLWPDLKRMYKSVHKVGEFIRVGFPTSSLTPRIIKPATDKKIRYQAVMEADLPPLTPGDTKPADPLSITTPKAVRTATKPILPDEAESKKYPIIILGPFSVDLEAYQRWRDEFLTDYNRVKNMMQPFYGSIPLYKKSYDLLQTLVDITRHLPREMRETLGAQIVNLIVEANICFFHYADTTEDIEKITTLDRLQVCFDTLTFLLRVCYDLDYINIDRRLEISEQLTTIRSQLEKMRQKLTQ